MPKARPRWNPNDTRVELERQILGCILQDSQLVAQVEFDLTNDFLLSEHRKLYRAALQLQNEGRDIDAVLWSQESKVDLAYITGLYECGLVPKFLLYVSALQQAAREQSVRRLAEELLNADPADHARIIEQLGATGYLNGNGHSRKLKTVSLAEIHARQQPYLWRPYIPIDQLIALYGPSHSAKSIVALDWAARITSGAPWPDGSPNVLGPQKVLLLAAGEDAPDTVLKPRFALAGGNPDLLRIIAGSIPAVKPGEKPPPIEEEVIALDSDLDRIEAVLLAEKIAMTICDPVTNHLGNRKTNVEEEVRPVLMRIKRMAERLSVPFIIIGHLNRRDRGTVPLDRLLGARSFSGVPRTIYITGTDNDSPEKFHYVLSQERGLGAKAWCYETQLQSISVDGADCEQVKLLWSGQSEVEGQEVVDPITSEEKSSNREAADELRAFLERSGGTAFKSECIENWKRHNMHPTNTSRVRRMAKVFCDRDERDEGRLGKGIWSLQPLDKEKTRVQG